MSRQLRAAWRLTVSVAHVLHGVAIVLTRFSAFDTARREALVQWWARKTLRTMGITLRVEGMPQVGGGLLVANHVSWLDILALGGATSSESRSRAQQRGHAAGAGPAALDTLDPQFGHA